MAHQCLKCGHSYPDGSPQILKGCEGCKGTRFFYTEKPVGEAEREQLQARTRDDLNRPGQPAQGASRERRIPTKGELPVGEGEAGDEERDWVSLGPGNLRTIVEDVVRRAHEKKPTFRIASDPGGADRPSLEEWVRRRQRELEAAGGDAGDDHARAGESRDDPGDDGSMSIVDDLLSPAEDEGPSDDAGERTKEAGEEVVYRRSSRTPKPSPSSLEPEPRPGPAREREVPAGQGETRSSEDSPGRDDFAMASVEKEADDEGPVIPEGYRPETVEVLEQGVYDLDVQRLLEKNPIVVHRDGKYSLHLPSLMESLGAASRKRR